MQLTQFPLMERSINLTQSRGCWWSLIIWSMLVLSWTRLSRWCIKMTIISTEEAVAGKIDTLYSLIGKQYSITETQEDQYCLWSGGRRILTTEDLEDISSVLSELMNLVS